MTANNHFRYASITGTLTETGKGGFYLSGIWFPSDRCSYPKDAQSGDKIKVFLEEWLAIRKRDNGEIKSFKRERIFIEHTYGRLTVGKEIEQESGSSRRFVATCSCGRLTEADLLELISGNKQSCSACDKPQQPRDPDKKDWWKEEPKNSKRSELVTSPWNIKRTKHTKRRLKAKRIEADKAIYKPLPVVSRLQQMFEQQEARLVA